MKKERKALFLFLLSLFFVLLPGQVLAEERSIYVGDLIELRISTREFSRDELADKFKDFEIVNMEEEAGGYLITLRSFETGEKKIQLGDKEIIIDIKSTLDEIERDGVFEGDLSPEEAGFYIDGQYVFYFFLVLSLLSGGIYLRRYPKRKNIAMLSPYQRFNHQREGISPEDSQYFVKLTACFKEYLEAVYSCRIRGKTSTEIIDKISGFPGLQANLPDIREWLTESDRLKFSGVTVSKGKKQEIYGRLLELVNKIQVLKIGELKTGEQKGEPKIDRLKEVGS